MPIRSLRLVPGLTIALLLTAMTISAEAKTQVHVWQRWEQTLTSARPYDNPYADVTVSVASTGPGGQTIRTYGFWDGGSTFKIRCAFPREGTWRWRTECSDTTNSGLHGQSGSVAVGPYAGKNPLYRRGFLKVSDNKRHLTYGDGTPFLWMGDTAWRAPLQAPQSDWETYIKDRLAKRFTLVQISPASRWAGTTDVQGNPPFLGEGISRWNPAYWQGFERKVQHANERGIVIFLNGLMEPTSRYPTEEDARLFARNIVARLFGSFLIFSPSFDSPYMPLGDAVAETVRDATKIHLITQHPNTPSGRPTHATAERYFDKPYLDICGVQTGHNNGNRDLGASQSIAWNLSLYRRAPHKPVINQEAFYDAGGTTPDLEPKYRGTARDARSHGYLSWLSGSLGYTYGAYGIWNWQTDAGKPFFWKKAMQYPSSREMQYLHDFFARIDWWRLEPAHELIRNQAAEPAKMMALAKSAEGDLAVAYLPDDETIEIEMAAFPAGMTAAWYDPTTGRYAPATAVSPSRGTHRFPRPKEGDWVLLLTRERKVPS